MIHVSGNAGSIPAQIEGVRTRVIYDSVPAPRVTADDVNRALAVKEAQVSAILGQGGVQGFGVGASDDNPAEPALVVYVDITKPHSDVPAVIGGMRTKVVEGDTFRAFGWGKETVKQPPVSCAKPATANIQPRKVLKQKPASF